VFTHFELWSAVDIGGRTKYRLSRQNTVFSTIHSPYHYCYQDLFLVEQQQSGDGQEGERP